MTMPKKSNVIKMYLYKRCIPILPKINQTVFKCQTLTDLFTNLQCTFLLLQTEDNLMLIVAVLNNNFKDLTEYDTFPREHHPFCSIFILRLMITLEVLKNYKRCFGFKQ